MLMPGRGGSILPGSGSGGTGGSDCAPGTLENHLQVNERADSRLEYKAREIVSLEEGFRSREDDVFSVVIDPTAAECVSDGGDFGGEVIYAPGAYRYGFNGKENDNEVKGEGNQQDYGMRMYDPRIGKFLSTDPLVRSFPMLAPYQYASNTPIEAIDLDGEEAKHYTLKFNETTGKNVLVHLGDVDIIEKKTIYEKRAVHGEQGEVVGYNWMPTSRMAKNERTEYVYHGIENIAAGHSGPSIPTALTWSFSTSREMEKAVDGGKLNWYTSNEKGAVTFGLMAYGALEAESEVGAAKGLWWGAKPGVDVLTKQVKATAAKMYSEGKAPSVVVGGVLPNGASAISTSGKAPLSVVPPLILEANKLGGLGAKVGKNTVGCCGEFHVANELLLNNPGYKPTDIQFTPAIRPSTGKPVPMCPTCKSMFTPNSKTE